MDHGHGCTCTLCRRVADRALPVLQADRDMLADAWAEWRGTEDLEVVKLRRGEDGSPASPRWIALQAIARTRLARDRVVTLPITAVAHLVDDSAPA